MSPLEKLLYDILPVLPRPEGAWSERHEARYRVWRNGLVRGLLDRYKAEGVHRLAGGEL